MDNDTHTQQKNIIDFAKKTIMEFREFVGNVLKDIDRN